MNTEAKKKKSDSWWARLLLSIIGTAIGVGLTFGVNNWRDQHKKAQAQRLMAIMVIHDIDESIIHLKAMKDLTESQYFTALYVKDRLDQLDSVPTDSISNALDFIVKDEQDFRFDISKEKIFHSSPETWQSLGNMKFIDNVQSFYHDRQAVQDQCNKSIYWQKPLPATEYEVLMFDSKNMSVEEYQEKYEKLLRELLKEKMAEEQVIRYINYTTSRLLSLVNKINVWTIMNDENKFLMSITDEELDDYVNRINQNGIAVTEKSLIGTWTGLSADEISAEWTFQKDHTFLLTNITSLSANLPYARGKTRTTYREMGTWTLERDSIITVTDSIDYDIDVSSMTAEPGKQEEMDNWIQNIRDSRLEQLRETMKDYQRKLSIRLDASQDKMEMKAEGVIEYYKRKK